MPKRAIQRAGDIKNRVSSAIKRGQRHSAEDEEQNEQNQNILDEFGVDTEIIVSKDILLPETVDAVAFSESEPRGFNYDDVEAFVDEAKHSIEYYIQLIHDKNWGIHKLATEINENRTNIEDLKYQLQIHRGKGVAEVDEEGNYITYDPNEDTSADTEGLQQELNSLESDLVAKEEEISSLSHEVSTLQETIENLQSDLQQIQDYADELEVYINSIAPEESSEEDTYENEEYDENSEDDDQYEEDYDEYDENSSDDDYEEDYDEYSADGEEFLSEEELDEDEVSAQQQLLELSAWGDEMEAALRALEDQNTELQQELETAQAQIDELKESGQVQDKRDDIIEELTNDNLTIREQFKISEEEKEALYAQYQEAVETTQVQETHINELNAYIDQLESENQKLKDKANNVRVELDSDRYPSTHTQQKQVPTRKQSTPAPRQRQQPPPPQKQEEKRRVMFSADDLLAPEIDE